MLYLDPWVHTKWEDLQESLLEGGHEPTYKDLYNLLARLDIPIIWSTDTRVQDLSMV